jgi:hypothetical protein
MEDNKRRLMPYEHQLVDALGITKEEYLDFVAQQQLYSDIKEGTLLDARNEIASTIALVLTIVGTILQVVAALVAEKPKEGGRTQTREDVFSPRSGFNSLQELGNYGDPINLIYTNKATNPRGGVRVASTLLWSAVKSYGSSQYVQLLLLLGAGGVGEIQPDRTAFGQTPTRDLVSQSYWLYFRPDGTGALRRPDRIQGADNRRDPGTVGAEQSPIYRINPAAPGAEGDGFSHAISPSTSNRFGVYAPVPINVQLESRFASGRITRANNQIKARDLDAWGEDARGRVNGRIRRGDTLRITLARTNREFPRIAEEEAAEFRRTVSAAFDNAGVMKLGSAKFVIDSISNGSTDDGEMTVVLSCIEGGRAPSAAYSKTIPDGSPEEANAGTSGNVEYDQLLPDVQRLLDEDQRDGEIITAQDLLGDGNIYVIDKRIVGGSTATGGPRISYTYKLKRSLTKSERNALRRFIEIGPPPTQFERERNDEFSTPSPADPAFFTKALVKIETAHYETLSPCHIVDFAIKARVWRRLSGRQEFYGRDQYEGYPSTDNGIKRRSAMFLVKYKRASETSFKYVKGIFVVRRAADVDNFIYLRFNSGQQGLKTASNWQFELEPVFDPIAEFNARSELSSGDKFNFFYLENSGRNRRIDLSGGAFINFTGTSRRSSNKLPPLNNSPRRTSEWDLFSHTADTQLQMSFDQGPELEISAVTEQIKEPFSSFPGLYQDLSLAGFNMYSGRNVQDLRSLSLFVNKGRKTRLLSTRDVVNGIGFGRPGYQYLPGAPNGYANTAPDIFIDTIDDKNDGIGQYVDNLFAIDVEQLAISKRFCEKNKLFMDGIIADFVSWRQFWADAAPFSLLELTKQDGKECLIPALPYNKDTGLISREVSIVALFNPGNILEDSYKEEFIDYGSSTQDVIVTMVYRDNERDGVFPRNNSVEVKLADVNENDAVRETIDMSAFVTRREQAILVGKFLCQTRRHSRRSIEFKTFPTDSFVAPGSFIYVELAHNQWDQIYTGIIEKDGRLSIPLGDTIADGTYQFLIYNPRRIVSQRSEGQTIYEASVNVVNGAASRLARYKDHIFVLGRAVKNKRVFRVVEVSMDEEGEVGIKAIEHPCDEQGRSLITQGLREEEARLFAIDGRIQ